MATRVQFLQSTVIRYVVGTTWYEDSFEKDQIWDIDDGEAALAIAEGIAVVSAAAVTDDTPSGTQKMPYSAFIGEPGALPANASGVLTNDGTGALTWTPAVGGAPSVFTDNGDGTFDHDDGSGTVVTFDANAPDEVIENAGVLTGAAPVGAQWGVDTTTGQAYYVSAGSWAVMPVTVTDLNITVSSEAGNNAAATPLNAPATPDTGDVHLEIYDDFLVWWSWGGAAWANSAQTSTSVVMATAISPAADDATGAIGVAALAAREDHKHPAQTVSVDANNSLTVGTDGLHYAAAVATPADAISPAADDATGAVGVGIGEYAREDHKHPAQTVSATANNILEDDPADGLAFYGGQERVFLDDTAVAPATAGEPTIAEITAAGAGSLNTLLYYTGDDLPVSTPTYAYWVDKLGAVTLIERPASGAAANDRLFLDDTTVAPAIALKPTDLEISTAAAAAVDVMAYYTGTDTSTDLPILVYHIDATGNVTRINHGTEVDATNALGSGNDGGLFVRSTRSVQGSTGATVFMPASGKGTVHLYNGSGGGTYTIAGSGSLPNNQTTDAFVNNIGTGPFNVIGSGLTYHGPSKVFPGQMLMLTYGTSDNDAYGHILANESAVSRLYESVTQVAHGFALQEVVYHDGTVWAKAVGSSGDTVAQGFVTDVIDVDNVEVTTQGVVSMPAHGLNIGEYYWLDQNTAGLVTATQPASGAVQQVLHIRDANFISVDIEQAVNMSAAPVFKALDYAAGATNSISDLIFISTADPTISLTPAMVPFYVADQDAADDMAEFMAQKLMALIGGMENDQYYDRTGVPAVMAAVSAKLTSVGVTWPFSEIDVDPGAAETFRLVVGTDGTNIYDVVISPSGAAGAPTVSGMTYAQTRDSYATGTGVTAPIKTYKHVGVYNPNTIFGVNLNNAVAMFVPVKIGMNW